MNEIQTGNQKDPGQWRFWADDGQLESVAITEKLEPDKWNEKDSYECCWFKNRKLNTD